MAANLITFGTAEFESACAGIYITSLKEGETSQSADVMDNSGNVVQTDRYGKKKTLQIEGTVKGDIAAVTVGGTLTVNTTVYTIDSVDKTHTNTGHYTVSISASAPWPPAAG